MNLGSAQVIRANSRHLPLADDSVDLVVTSPPYFALRSYQDGGQHYDGQIGDEPTPAEFVASLLEVTAECVRVLKPSGSLWVNLGDKYSQPGKGERNGQGIGGTIIHKAGANTANRSARDFDYNGVRGKSLIGIPWRYALRCIDDLGLILRAEVIWSKPNGLPESVTDRVRRSHEVWFHFTLEPRYFSAVDEIREPHVRGPRPNEVRGDPGRGINGGVVPARSDFGQPGNKPAEFNPLGKLPGSVWTIPTEPLRVPDHLGVDHFAAFPTEWPKRIIQGWSPAGVCVACGEGRRPVTDREQIVRAPNGLVELGKQSHRADAKRQTRGDVISVRDITGYACACGTQQGDTWTPSAPSQTDTSNGCESEPTASQRASASTTTSTTPAPTPPPTRPAVVLDPFGGTGTTAMVAKALGRHGISVDMSADYCRLSQWRTNDRNQLAKVLGIAKADKPHDDEQSLLDLIDGGAA